MLLNQNGEPRLNKDGKPMPYKFVRCTMCLYLVRWRHERQPQLETIINGEMQPEYYCTNPKRVSRPTPVDTMPTALINDSLRRQQPRTRYSSGPPVWLTTNMSDPEDRAFTIIEEPWNGDGAEVQEPIIIPANHVQMPEYDESKFKAYLLDHGVEDLGSAPDDLVQEALEHSKTMVEVGVYTQRRQTASRARDVMMIDEGCKDGVWRFAWQYSKVPVPLPETLPCELAPQNKPRLPETLLIKPR